MAAPPVPLPFFEPARLRSANSPAPHCGRAVSSPPIGQTLIVRITRESPHFRTLAYIRGHVNVKHDPNDPLGTPWIALYIIAGTVAIYVLMQVAKAWLP